MQTSAERTGDETESTGTNSGSTTDDEIPPLIDENEPDNGHFSANLFGLRFGISYQFGNGQNGNLRRRRRRQNNFSQNQQPTVPANHAATEALANWIENNETTPLIDTTENQAENIEQIPENNNATLPETLATNLVNVFIGNNTSSDSENGGAELANDLSEAQIEQVRAILPFIPREEIIFSLRRHNGSVTNTINDLLDWQKNIYNKMRWRWEFCHGVLDIRAQTRPTVKK